MTVSVAYSSGSAGSVELSDFSAGLLATVLGALPERFLGIFPSRLDRNL